MKEILMTRNIFQNFDENNQGLMMVPQERDSITQHNGLSLIGNSAQNTHLTLAKKVLDH